MSQHDYNIANGGGASVRADINNALLAILSQNSGATAPTTTKPFMFWYDTTTGVLKMRNAADTGWVDAITGITGGNGLGMVNRIINGRCEVDQYRNGASVTPAAGTTYIIDRFNLTASQASKFSAQQNAGAVTPPVGFKNYLGFTSLSAYSSLASDYFLCEHVIEGLNVTDLGWGTANAQPITVSVWVRSSLTGTHSGSLRNGALNRSYPFTFTINAANTWEQKLINIAGDTAGTWAVDNTGGVRLSFDLGTGTTYRGTAGAWAGASYAGATGAVSVVGTNGATFYATGVDFRKGIYTSAPPADWRSYGVEEALCKRYFQVPINTVGHLCTGFIYAANSAYGVVSLSIAMRATPTVTFSGSFYGIDATGTGRGMTAGVYTASITNVALNFTAGFNLNAGNGTVIGLSSSGYMWVNAEL